MEREKTEGYQRKANFFLIAGIVASTVSVPMGLAFLGVAGYEYIRMQGSKS